ncbi:MAG: hypothetical protein KF774_01010 [Planctomyces sp.]|nr:hypothetical protein [Planctomyces sp.]
MRPFALCLLALLPLGAAVAEAQSSPRYYPLDHRVPGQAGQWQTTIDRTRQGKLQVVEFLLPDGGHVSHAAGSDEAPIAAPATTDLLVGRVHRFRISDLEEFPGIELYPSVEMLDHLHAPAGLERDFPVPIAITAEDIEAAIQNRLVTKVVYLEQPDLALPEPQNDGPHTTEFSPRANLLKVADERGRPIAILRLGGRRPDPRTGHADFSDVEVIAPITPSPAKVRVSTPAAPRTTPQPLTAPPTAPPAAAERLPLEQPAPDEPAGDNDSSDPPPVELDTPDGPRPFPADTDF